jgi:tetratricopeptide (TPR) repeat protein
VISPASAFRYAGQRPEPPRLWVELGADYVVDGSVRRSEDRLRVTARLTDTKTSHQLWANSFDRPYGQVFALQDSLVATIVAQVDGAILDKEHRARIHRDPSDLTAWDLALRASWHFRRPTRDSNTQARSLFEEALRRDTALPLAWYSLAMTHQRAIVNQWSKDPRDSLREMRQVCAAFASSHPGDPGLHIATAYADVYSGDRQSAMGRLREAIEIDPNAANAYVLYGQTLAMEKQPDEAIEQLEVAMRLSPRDSDLWTIQTAVALAHFVAERYGEMLDWAKAAVQTVPHAPFPYGTLAVAHAYLGDLHEARAAVQRLLGIEPKTTVGGLRAIVASTSPDVVVRYVEGLRRAGVPE